MVSFSGNNRFIAAILPLTVLTVTVAVLLGEQGAIDALAQRSASLQVDLNTPLDYRDLDAPQIKVLILLASAAAVLPACRFYEFLKGTLKSRADKA